MGTAEAETDFDHFLVLVQCVHCASPHKALKLLTCYHSSCVACLEEHGGDQIKCPKCSHGTDMEQGVHGLEENFLQKSDCLVSILTGNRKCRRCATLGRGSVEKPAYVCLECDGDLMCEACHSFHQGEQESEDHKPLVISDIFNSQFDVLPQMRELYSKELCLTHAGKELEHYCKTCSKLACVQCLEENHDEGEHDKVLLEDVANLKRQEVTVKLDELRKKLDDVTSGIGRASDAALNELKTLKIRVVDTMAFAEVSNKMATDTEIIRYSAHMVAHIDRLCATEVAPPPPTPPVAAKPAPFVSRFRETFSHKPGALAKAIEQFRKKQLQSITVKEYSSFEIIKLINGMEINNYGEVAILGGKYLRYMSYTGEERGKIRLKMRNPFDLACLDTDVYVADCNMRAVLRMGRDCRVKRKWLLPQETEKQFKGTPIGIDVTTHGEIYVVSYASCIIYKLMPDNPEPIEWLTKAECKAIKNYPYTIVKSNNGDVVMTTSKMLVSVKEGKEVRFSNKKVSNCHGVCTDAFNHIFVANYPKNSVDVYSQGGDLILTLLNKKVHGIKHPRRVSVSPDGEYLAVAHKECKISFFKLGT